MLDSARSPSSQSKARPRRIFLVLAAALAVVGGLYWHLSRAQTAQTASTTARQAVPVTVARVQQGDIPVYFSGLGTIQPLSTVTIRSRVDGQIVKIGFKQGEMVEKGDLIAQIDPRPFQAQLEQAQAKLAQDKALLANARLDLTRYTELAKKDFASVQKLDTQKATVAQLEAQIAGDQAAIDSARTQLDYTTIRAPMRGRAGFLLVDEGNIVRASDANGIVVLTQVNPINAEFSLPERDLPDILKALKSSEVKAWASDPAGSFTEEGRLALIDNRIDQASGTVRLKAVFPNADGMLWPGQSVSVKVQVETLQNAVSVPAEAVQRGTDGLYAYVVKPDGSAAVRMLKAGPIAEGRAVIEAGVKPGETVVVSGQYRLRPGVKVDPNAVKTALTGDRS